MIRAVVATNIIVSGLLFGGVPYAVVKAGLDRRFAYYLSAPLITEIERVFRAKKFGLSEEEVLILTEPFFDLANVVVPTETINIIPRCPGDNRVLECAVAGGCHYIITGDRRDLISLKSFGNISIITAREFLALLK